MNSALDVDGKPAPPRNLDRGEGDLASDRLGRFHRRLDVVDQDVGPHDRVLVLAQWRPHADQPATIQRRRATVKATDGVGAYALGDLLLNFTRQLSAEERSQLLDAMSTSGFWSLPAEEENLPGLDGATWIIEGVRETEPFRYATEYHYVQRWSPRPGPVRDLGLLFLRLAELEAEIY